MLVILKLTPKKQNLEIELQKSQVTMAMLDTGQKDKPRCQWSSRAGNVSKSQEPEFQPGDPHGNKRKKKPPKVLGKHPSTIARTPVHMTMHRETKEMEFKREAETR